mmetsp:Transcript_16707/g.36135  ORF Transcript_16707/g.36135 Transcript_16707/m.36135 type:complete len:215 (+) Transcript_16707:242-886(+)
MLKVQNRPPISKDLDSIINGYTAGDGYLKPSGALQVEQGKDQLKFVQWMFEKLKAFCTPTCKIADVYQTNKETKQKELRSHRFYTTGSLKDYHENWYQRVGPNFEKRLPVGIDRMFTPLFITVWFACDGTKPDDCRGAKFEVTAYTVKERKKLKNLFLQKYQIDAKINKQGVSKSGKEQWALCILAEDYDKFYALVTQDPLIPTLFPYKLCKKP